MKLIIDIDDKEKAICEQYINGKLSDELGDYVNVTELAEAIQDSTPITEGDLIMFRTLMTEIANKGLPFEEVLLLIDNAPTVDIKDQIAGAYNEGYMCGSREAEKARPQGELKEYKPLELDYNVKSAVENLKTAYWSNDTEKYAQAFTEADQMIVSAICHHGYIVCKRPQGEWVEKEETPASVSYYCSVCKTEGIPITPFCPWCGAKMKGEEE